MHSHGYGLPAACILGMPVQMLLRASLYLRLVGHGLVLVVTPDDKRLSRVVFNPDRLF